jgi:hypothetical protein
MREVVTRRASVKPDGTAHDTVQSKYLSMTTGQPSTGRVAVVALALYFPIYVPGIARSSRSLLARFALVFVYQSHACPLSGLWYPICRYPSTPSPSSAYSSPASPPSPPSHATIYEISDLRSCPTSPMPLQSSNSRRARPPTHVGVPGPPNPLSSPFLGMTRRYRRDVSYDLTELSCSVVFACFA